MKRVTIEIGVEDSEGLTHWPALYKTYADLDDLERAFTHVLRLAKSEKRVTGFRTTIEKTP